MRQKLLASLLIPALVAGCIAVGAKQVDWSDGSMVAAAAASGVATLRCWPSVNILSFDGDTDKHLAVAGGLYFRKCDIAVAPGPHALVVQYAYSFSNGHSMFTFQSPKEAVTFVAEPGRIYELHESRKYGQYFFEVRAAE